MDSPTAIGFDLSLTRSGVAVVGPEGIECASFGRKGKRDEPLEMRHERIEALADQLVNVVHDHLEHPKVATIEDNPFGAAGGSAHDRSGLWWAVYGRLHRLGIPTVQVNVSKVKIYATGRGNKLEKDDILLATVRRHPEAPISNNDEADAVNLALMGARLVGIPYEKSLPQTHLRAMEGLGLP
jgi:Holliday junction resolvasome RuvABC endonuclease subunit